MGVLISTETRIIEELQREQDINSSIANCIWDIMYKLLNKDNQAMYKGFLRGIALFMAKEVCTEPSKVGVALKISGMTVAELEQMLLKGIVPTLENFRNNTTAFV